jgi:predicted dienelactone hydrolase
MTTDHHPLHRRARGSGPPPRPPLAPSQDHRLLASVGVRARRRLALLALVVVAGILALPTGGQAQTVGFPSVGTAFDRPGSFAVTVNAESAHTYYAPTTLGAGGLRHPVILWGNGTFNTPSTYDSFLRHLASHGFIVAAANTSNSGSGREMLAGLDNLTTKDRTTGNRFAGKVDLTRVAAMGYSQGGGGAMVAARDPRVDITVAIQPWNASASGVRVPTLYLAGSADAVVSASSVERYFDASTAVPAAFANVRGATHFEVLGDGGAFRGPATAWVRFYLMADANARPVFIGTTCTLCTSSAYTEYRANARLATSGPIGPTPTTTPSTTAPPTTAPPTTSPSTTCRWWMWWCN